MHAAARENHPFYAGRMSRSPFRAAPDDARGGPDQPTEAFRPPERGPAEESPAADHFELEEKLGVGATATVWHAHDVQHDRDVALKLLHPHLLDDEKARRRIEAEARSAAELDHPSIVPVVETSFTDDEAALVMPFIEGQTLADRLARDSAPLEPREAAAIAADIADALTFAHRSGIVHRDVKPSNVLLGEDGRARLLDFGISRPLAEAADELTGTGMTIGTLPYMAPEQLAGQRDEPASDVFALGAVLYEMLSGQRPYDAATPVVLAAAQRTPPPALVGVPAALADLALAALQADAASRPAAADVARSLHEWLAGGADPAAATVPVAVPVPPAVVAPAPLPVVRPQTARIGRTPVLVGALVAVLGLALVGAMAFNPNQAGIAPTSPSASPSVAPTQSAAPTLGAVPAAPAREKVGDNKGKGGKGKDDKGKDDKGKGGDNKGKDKKD
jgi:eukaryotic-like serine/threonine-protein kinase